MSFETTGGVAGLPEAFPQPEEEAKKPVSKEAKTARVARRIGAGKPIPRRVKRQIRVPGRPEAAGLAQEAVTGVKRKGKQKTLPVPAKRREMSLSAKRGHEEVGGVSEEIEISEKRSVDVSALPPDKLLEELKTELDSLQDNPDPIPLLEERVLPFLDQIAKVDARYAFLKEDIHSLVATMKRVPNASKKLLLPLLRKIYIEDPAQKGFTVGEARKTVADLLFLLDQHPEVAGKLDSLESLGGSVETVFSEIRSTLFPFRNKDIIKHLYPMTVARLLLRPDGTLNFGLIDRVKSLAERETHPSFVRDAHSVLKELQTDPTLCEKLRTFPTPQPGSVLDKAIHACLELPYDAPITHHDVERVCLAALLGWWRQGGLGNCWCISFTSCVKDATLHWILDDLIEIAKKEAVTRQIGDRTCEFPVLFRLPRSRSKETFYFPDALCDSFQAFLKYPCVKNACLLLGCTPGKESDELYAASQAVATEEKNTYFSLFQWFAKKNGAASKEKNTYFSLFQWLAKKNGKDTNTLREALQCIDATAEAPLLSLCENAIGSMYFPLLSVPMKGGQRTDFARGLVKVFLEMAETAKLPCSVKALQSMYFGDLTEQEQRLIDLFGLAGTLWYDETGSRYSDQLLKNLGSPHFKSLDRLVMAYAPPDFPKSSFPESNSPVFVLCEKTDKGTKPLSQERRGSLLLEMFYSLSESLGDSITPETRELFHDSFSVGARLGVKFYRLIHFDPWEIIFPARGAAGSTSLEEAYFGNSSGWETIHLTRVRDGIVEVLAKSKVLQERIGTDRAISLQAEMPAHRLRFLPTHPTVVRACADPEKSLTLYEEQGKALLQKPLSSFPGLKFVIERAMSQILPKRAVVVGAEASTTPIAEVIRKYHDALQAAVPGVLFEEQEDLFDTSILRVLVTEDSSYHDPFLHFADTNWEGGVGLSTLKNTHLSFWYNPMKDTWRLVRVPEGGGVEDNSAVYSREKSEYIAIELPGPKHQQALSAKQLLTLEGKMRNKLLQVETAFIEKSHYLERNLSSLSPKKRRKVFEQPLPDLTPTLREALTNARKISVKTPESPEEALLQCRELQILSRFIREKAIKEVALKLPEGALAEQGIEVRKVRLGAYSTELFRLDDPESFSRWVMEQAYTEEAKEQPLIKVEPVQTERVFFWQKAWDIASASLRPFL